MATNRAAQELEALMSMGQGNALPDLSDEVLVDDEPRSRTPGEAKFGTPEAVGTAVAASFILGPVGGILMGISQGLLGKQMRQGQLDAAAAEANALADADALVSATFAQQRAGLNEADTQQLNTIQSQYEAAKKMLQSPFEETRKNGIAIMQSTLAAQREFDVRQEEQAIARSTAEDTAKRELGQETYERYTQSIGRFNDESKGYLAVSQATKGVLSALDQDSPVGQMAAIKMLEKALDPTSVVRPEEQQAYGQMGGIWDQIQARAQLLKTGRPLTQEQVDEVEDLVMEIDQISTDFQRQRELRYADEADDIGLDDKYKNNFKLTGRSMEEEGRYQIGKGYLSEKLGREATDEEVNSFWQDILEDSLAAKGVGTALGAASLALESDIVRWVAGGAAGAATLGHFGGRSAERIIERHFNGGPVTPLNGAQQDAFKEWKKANPKHTATQRLTKLNEIRNGKIYASDPEYVAETATKYTTPKDAVTKTQPVRSAARRVGGGAIKWLGRLGLAGLVYDVGQLLYNTPEAGPSAVTGPGGVPGQFTHPSKKRPTN